MSLRTSPLEAQPELDVKRREMLGDAEKLARIGSFEWDILANEVTWSDGLYAIYGLEPGEFEASFEAFLAQLHPEDRHRVRATIEKAAQTGQPFTTEERIVRRDGSVRTLRSRGEVLLDARGEAVRILGVCQDITEAKRAEELSAAWNETLEQRVRERTDQLQTANAKLAEALEQLTLMQQQMVSQAKMAAVGNLVAGIAHELNTPLGALKGVADVVSRSVPRMERALRGTESQESKRYLEALRENARTAAIAGKRLSDLMERLELLSEPDDAPSSHLDLHDTLDGLLTVMRHRAPDGVRITKDYGELPLVWCNPGQLSHALTSLLLNAFQALDEAGDVRLATWSDGQNVYVRIQDTGRGILREKLERLFDIGFTTRSAKVRLGTGLFNANNIVQRHGGDIAVESEVGSGSSFTVRLPLRSGVDPR